MTSAIPARFLLATVLGIAAIIVGLTGSNYLPTTPAPKAAPTSKATPTPSPKVTAAADPLPTTEPAPPLLDRSDIDPVATLVSDQQDQAATLLKTWWSTHGTDIDDDAFATWAGSADSCASYEIHQEPGSSPSWRPPSAPAPLRI